MDRCSLIAIQPILISAFLLSLSGCSGGGSESGDAGAPAVAAPSLNVVSGSVQAPAGQIAFFRQKGFGDVFVSEAYAALTGLANVPDNTVVQLARLNSTATTFNVLSTTTTLGGRYAFNLATLGLQPANDFIVRVAGPGGKEMRAFVVGTVADISPVSEAACQLILEALGSGSLTNLTIQEVSDIHNAVGLIAALQGTGTVTSVDQAVRLVKAAINGNAQIAGYVASTGAIGQTTQGPGDIGNFFPFRQGNFWEYQKTTSTIGKSVQMFSNTFAVPGTKVINNLETTVVRQSNPENNGRSEEAYILKDASGITAYGSNDSTDTLTSQVVPYRAVHFPLPLGNPFVALNRRRVTVAGEPFDLTDEIQAVGFENVKVVAGEFLKTLKMERTQVLLVPETNTAIVRGKETSWFAQNIGEIKRTLIVQGGGQTETETEELVRSVVDGVENSQGVQIRKLALKTNDLVYDEARNTIYASVPGNPGKIISLDPSTGALGRSIDVGNQPNKLAISHNGQLLYVGLDGEAAIRRVDLVGFMAELLIPLGSNPVPGCGAVVVGDIEPLPGVPNAIAVSKYHSGCTPRFSELVIYDDGIQRPNIVQQVNPGGVRILADFIEFSNSPSVLYAFDGASPQLFRFSITSDGLALSTVANISPGAIVRDLQFNGNMLYTDTGHIIDPGSGVVLGQFPGTPAGGALVRPDVTIGRTFFLPSTAGSCGPINLLVYDQVSFHPIASNQIQGLNCPFGFIDTSSLIRWGANGLAFRTFEGDVVILRVPVKE